MSNEHLQKVIQDSYIDRGIHNTGNYSWFHPDVCLYRQEKQREILKLLRKNKITDLSNKTILEVGCGFGDNLINLINMGASPELVHGNDLLEDRIVIAKNRLPIDVDLRCVNASDNSYEYKFDIILQSTVFSSIPAFPDRQELANIMVEQLKADGLILWYDFHFDNPKNRNVKGIKKAEIYKLFPDCKIQLKSITLAPPICRKIVRRIPYLYFFLNLFPFLRTHTIAIVSREQ